MGSSHSHAERRPGGQSGAGRRNRSRAFNGTAWGFRLPRSSGHCGAPCCSRETISLSEFPWHDRVTAALATSGPVPVPSSHACSPPQQPGSQAPLSQCPAAGSGGPEVPSHGMSFVSPPPVKQNFKRTIISLKLLSLRILPALLPEVNFGGFG